MGEFHSTCFPFTAMRNCCFVNVEENSNVKRSVKTATSAVVVVCRLCSKVCINCRVT